jgi:hypothetical protein
MRKEHSEDVVVGGKDFQIEVYVTDDGLNRVCPYLTQRKTRWPWIYRVRREGARD